MDGMDGLNGMNRLLDRKGGLSACCAASRYDVVHDLWVIAAYYNPHGYKTRAKNHALFAAKLEQSGIPLLTVECAFGDEPFALPDGPQVLKLCCASVLWQKERLLNVAVSALPPRCTKVAWLDADILFARPDWAVLTSKLLDTYAVVQVFDHVVCPDNHRCIGGCGVVDLPLVQKEAGIKKQTETRTGCDSQKTARSGPRGAGCFENQRLSGTRGYETLA